MKVTVNFGTVRVIVPCGSGELLVRQLMELAITRYKKATGKNLDVIIHNLKVSSDGGILDPDDTLVDVADDKEQIVASFEENRFPFLPHHAGDGTSASSVGTESPDFLQREEFIESLAKKALRAQTAIGMLPLRIRRGSEPVLNQISPLPTLSLRKDASKRWSAEIMVDDDCFKKCHISSKSEECIKINTTFLFDEREDGSGEERSVQKQDERKEPLGGPLISPTNDDIKQKMNFDCAFQGIDPDGWIDCHNKCNIADKAENDALVPEKETSQNIEDMSEDALNTPQMSQDTDNDDSVLADPELPTPPMSFFSDEVLMPKPKLLTPTKKIIGYCKSPSSAHSSLRKVGRRILIHLEKGSIGLGFSISSSESGAPLFIKNILPAGAAVEDGRLKVGDRILEVNRIDVSKSIQTEVVELLRNIPFGKSVELVVSRPEADNSPSPHLPRQLPPEKDGAAGIFQWRQREVFTFDIPLNDTGAAGLGLSVKGKTSATEKGTVDMGIFVKSVIHGGAASKDGRLCPNDQLLNINGISLLAGSNSQAMETLRRAVIQGEGPNAITLIVARRIPSPMPNHHNENLDSVCHTRNDSLLSESGESFYVSNENISSAVPKSKSINTFSCDNSENTVIQPTHKLNSSDKLLLPESKSCGEHLMNFAWHGPERTIVDASDSNEPFIKKLTLMDVGLNEHYIFSRASENGIPIEADSLKQEYRCSMEQQNRHPPDSMTFSKVRTQCGVYGRATFTRQGRTRQSMPEKELRHINCQDQSERTNYREVLYNQCMQTSKAKRSAMSPSDAFENSSQNRKARTDTVIDRISNSTDSLDGQTEHCDKPGSCHSPGCPYHIAGLGEHRNQCLPQKTGPILGMQKSSSMESLQTLMHEKQKTEQCYGKNTSRGCNDSFRAAVDRSYDTSYQEEIEDGRREHRTKSHHVRSATVGTGIDELAREKTSKHKKKGLLKGLGSVFRFGKSKKTNEECMPEKKDRKCRADEHVLDKKSFPEQKRDSSHTPSRQERMHVLRAEHQRRHQQRQGSYPQERREQQYEDQIQKMFDKKDMWRRPLPPIPHQVAIHSQEPVNGSSTSNSRNYEIYKEMSKPGSRRGFADPDRYCHYVNFQEIQHQLEHSKPEVSNQQELMYVSPSKHGLARKSSKPYRHTLSSHRTQLTTDFFEKEIKNSTSKRASGAQSLPRQSFSSSRQRPPIPAYMIAAATSKNNFQPTSTNHKSRFINEVLSRSEAIKSKV